MPVQGLPDQSGIALHAKPRLPVAAVAVAADEVASFCVRCHTRSTWAVRCRVSFQREIQERWNASVADRCALPAQREQLRRSMIDLGTGNTTTPRHQQSWYIVINKITICRGRPWRRCFNESSRA
jgi:hypothetical protein